MVVRTIIRHHVKRDRDGPGLARALADAFRVWHHVSDSDSRTTPPKLPSRILCLPCPRLLLWHTHQCDEVSKDLLGVEAQLVDVATFADADAHVGLVGLRGEDVKDGVFHHRRERELERLVEVERLLVLAVVVVRTVPHPLLTVLIVHVRVHKPRVLIPKLLHICALLGPQGRALPPDLLLLFHIGIVVVERVARRRDRHLLRLVDGARRRLRHGTCGSTLAQDLALLLRSPLLELGLLAVSAPVHFLDRRPLPAVLLDGGRPPVGDPVLDPPPPHERCSLGGAACRRVLVGDDLEGGARVEDVRDPLGRGPVRALLDELGTEGLAHLDLGLRSVVLVLIIRTKAPRGFGGAAGEHPRVSRGPRVVG
mmetsp:Transcript_14016/g.34253  ORF Transcript_14016/g.34253 Transcript_14016/m.34253 type:complete len:367 (-) Transcript_14016:113-1213(-)